MWPARSVFLCGNCHRWNSPFGARNHNEWIDFKEWEHTAFFVGSALSYRTERWWATLTVLPQVYGKNFGENPDDEPALVLDQHEKINVRLLVGVSF